MMNDNEIRMMLRHHEHWLNKDVEGWESMKADFHGENLRYANLNTKDLRYAFDAV